MTFTHATSMMTCNYVGARASPMQHRRDPYADNLYLLYDPNVEGQR